MQIPWNALGEMNSFEEYNELHEPLSRELIGMFIQDTMNREAGKVAPDTAGVLQCRMVRW